MLIHFIVHREILQIKIFSIRANVRNLENMNCINKLLLALDILSLSEEASSFINTGFDALFFVAVFRRDSRRTNSTYRSLRNTIFQRREREEWKFLVFQRDYNAVFCTADILCRISRIFSYFSPYLISR